MGFDLTLFASFVLFFCLKTVSCQEPVVEISQGILRGKTLTNRNGGTFYGFQSIPYAQPPINELRFKAPVRAEGWEGIREATEDLPSCWNYISGLPFQFGQEDCLYLNVFTSGLPSQNTTRKPVMVFVHGGIFTAGSGTTLLYGPEFLLTKDVVLVVINYRLGIFGFLNLDDPELEVPGNAGMKDQVMALKWVNENIEQFGGDPDNVLIFGESAGGASTHLLMLSPMTTGLFNKVIAQSGTAIMTLVDGTRNSGEVVAQQLGIQTDNWNDMLASLREVSGLDLTVAAQTITKNQYEYFAAPIVEVPSNEPAFLPNSPIDIIQSGDYNQVPFLTGFNDAEGLLQQILALLSTGQNMLIEDFTYFVPKEFELESGSELEKKLSQRVKEFYFGETEPSRDDIAPAVALYRDYLFAFPAYRSVLEHLKTSTTPIYFYQFSADTDLNVLKQLDESLRSFPGAAHADDIGYLFNNLFTPPSIAEGSVEDLRLRNMVDLWTNFAIHGTPTPDDSAGFQWTAVEENSFNYLHISTNTVYSDVNPKEEYMQFWYDLYEEYLPN